MNNSILNKSHGILVLLYATNTKQDLEIKTNKKQQHTQSYNIANYQSEKVKGI